VKSRGGATSWTQASDRKHSKTAAPSDRQPSPYHEKPHLSHSLEQLQILQIAFCQYHLRPFNPSHPPIMHRTYSMRQSRAPTVGISTRQRNWIARLTFMQASQIQNPPPPSSSTKSGRFFGKANIGMSDVNNKGVKMDADRGPSRPHLPPQVCRRFWT
jgi:hypothetical protein